MKSILFMNVFMLLINEENDHTCDFILKYYENNNSLYEPPCRYFDNNLDWLQCLPTCLHLTSGRWMWVAH